MIKLSLKDVLKFDRDYHKNHSKRIIPLALANYYINDIQPEETIYNHLNKDDNYSFADNHGIYDFCIGAINERF